MKTIKLSKLRSKFVDSLKEIEQNQQEELTELILELKQISNEVEKAQNKYIKVQTIPLSLFSRPLIYDHSVAVMSDFGELEVLIELLQEKIKTIEKAKYRYFTANQKKVFKKIESCTRLLNNFICYFKDWAGEILSAKRDKFDQTHKKVSYFKFSLIKHVSKIIKYHQLKNQYQTFESQL